MISWGSFLLGSCIFGILSFVVGCFLGYLLPKNNVTSPLITISRNALYHLSENESLHFEACITKTKGGDDDSFEEVSIPEIPEQDWRNN